MYLQEERDVIHPSLRPKFRSIDRKKDRYSQYHEDLGRDTEGYP